jgi:hypothetical protein
MISKTLKFLELQKSKVLISIARYKNLFDILFPYDFITPKNEIAGLLNAFHLALKQNFKKMSFKIYTFFKKTICYLNFTLGWLFFFISRVIAKPCTKRKCLCVFCFAGSIKDLLL